MIVEQEETMGNWDCTKEDTWRDVMEWRARVWVNKLAVVSPQTEKQYTFGEFNLLVNQIANALLKLGAKKGDRVALIGPDLPEFLAVTMTCKAGIVPTPINWRLKADELTYVINDCGARIIFVGQQYADGVKAIHSRTPDVKHYVCLDGRRPDMPSFDEFIAGSSPDEPGVDVFPEDMLAIIYTSGTTALPKGVVKKNRDALAMMRLINGLGQIRHDDRILGLYPLFHAGLVHASFVSYMFTATQWILQRFDPEAVLQTIDRYKITNLMLVPTMLIRLMDHPTRPKYDLSSLRSIVYTGSPMPVEQMRRAMEIFGPVLYQGFGMTEGGGQMSLTTADHILALKDPSKQHLLKSVGKCLPGCEMRLVDDNDNDVKPGEIGEIVFRSRAMIDGYWNKPKESAELLRNGWLHTGDMGRLDEDGYLYIVDRKKDVIVSGAEKIPSKEVEDVIYQFPVAEVAVIGVPSKEWGEEVKAIVVPKEGVPTTPEAIIKFCNERLSGFKRPRSVEIWKELPKNPTGKILKRDIREKFWAGQERRVS